MKTLALHEYAGAAKWPGIKAPCIEGGTSPVGMYQIATIVVARRTAIGAAKNPAFLYCWPPKVRSKNSQNCENAAENFAAIAADEFARRPGNASSTTARRTRGAQ